VRLFAAVIAALVALTGSVSESVADSSPAPLAQARSQTVEDRVYPRYGDPVVDALRYRLDLAWAPDTRTLDAQETLTFRATRDARRFRLALGKPLDVTAARLDGRTVRVTRDGIDVVVHHRVKPGKRHRLELTYSGTPKPVRAPTERTDIDKLGWTVTDDGGVWTMQEPYGAFTWYAVNDQPADKALYDIRITVPEPMVGVANGRLISRHLVDGDTVTRWRLDQPASSYLTTVAIDELTMTEDESSSGVPITYWTPVERPGLIKRLQKAPKKLDWLEKRLGRYPFETVGIVVVDSTSGMETQTMITLGNTKYATSPDVLLHEIAHHWYGDEVTPTDWRDVWMSEGMATYLQAVWATHGDRRALDRQVRQWYAADQRLRDTGGPPAHPRRAEFGAPNVYYIPAVMWDRLRHRVGNKAFWRLVRAWPLAHRYGNPGYDDITRWWSRRTGEDLSDFFQSWLLSRRTPGRG
jgi:aminopeptidase N